MLDLYYHPAAIASFGLVLIRVATAVFVAPAIGTEFLPAQWKIGCSVLLAMALAPIVQSAGAVPAELPAAYLLVAAARETLVGLLLGLTAGLIFAGVLLAGHIVGMQMGLSIAEVYDPLHGANVSVIGQFQYLIAIVLFLGVDGHHLVIRGLADSFAVLPVGALTLSAAGPGIFATLGAKIFSIGIQLAAALTVLLLLETAALGIISRMVPQMNVFFIGMPAGILIGLFGLGLSVPYVTRALLDLFAKIPEDFARVLGAS